MFVIMAQTKDGAIKYCAKYYGFTVGEYLEKIKNESYCNKCKSWKPVSKFCKDNSRVNKLHKNCKDCRWINNGIHGRPFVTGQQSIFKGKKHNEKSKEKMRKNNAGAGNPNWKGGITSLIMQIRNLAEFKEWRLRVYRKGNFTCEKCNIKKSGANIILDADHIIPLSKIIFDNNVKSPIEALLIPEIWNVDNGRCM